MLKLDTHISPEEYLAFEEKSRDKHEYWQGEIYIMAGTSLNHNQIVNNMYRALDQRLERRPYQNHEREKNDQNLHR